MGAALARGGLELNHESTDRTANPRETLQGSLNFDLVGLPAMPTDRWSCCRAQGSPAYS